MPNSINPPDERGLRYLIYELKDEIFTFLHTRVELFRSEFQEAVRGWKEFLPLSLGALIFLGSGFALLTMAFVSLLTVAFWGNPYHWFFAFLIVGIFWAVIGAILGYFAYDIFRKRARFPRKSVEVLREDKIWIQTEIRGHS